MKAIALFFLCAFLLPAEGFSGALFKVKTTDKKGDAETNIYLEKEKMKMDQPGKNSLIFDNKSKMIWIVDNAKKSYYEMTHEDLQKMGKQMGGMMEMMQKQMANMPPEQRAMMEKMMAGKMGGMMGKQPPAGDKQAEKKYSFKLVKKGVAIGKWNTTQYSAFDGAEKVSDLWFCTWKDLGLKEDPKPVVLELGKFFKEFAKSMQSMMPMGEDKLLGQVEDWEKMGIPLKVVKYKGVDVQSTSLVTEVADQSFKDQDFKVPDGMTKKSNIMGDSKSN